jgi:hypothetical protein
MPAMNVNWLLFPVIVLSLMGFLLGQFLLSRITDSRMRIAFVGIALLAGVPGFLMSLYYFHLFDNAVWFYEFRSGPYTELLAAGLGLSFGVLAKLFQGVKIVSKPFLATLAILTVSLPYVKPILAPLRVDAFTDRWQDNICLQSTPSPCGAASAATVFRQFGINRTESEVARECFTYSGGTENWYIARALQNRDLGVKFRIVNGFPPDVHTPAIAGVRVGRAGHFIVIVARTASGYTVADPLTGRQDYPSDRIAQEYEFTGFFMEVSKGKLLSTPDLPHS